MAATLWVSERLTRFTGQSVPLFLGGDSAGANLATVATRRLHETKSCRVAGNVLVYPSTDNEDSLSSCSFDPPFLKVADIAWFFEQYLPDRNARMNPDFAPVHADNLDLLPPTFIVTAEHDILTVQAEQYGEKLRSTGVNVRISRYAGMIHGFLCMDVFFPGAAGAAMREIRDFVVNIKTTG
jgi:acetyl esterase